MLADGAKCVHFMNSMVFAEIKPQIEKLPHDEMLKALAYMKHLLHAENPEYKSELARRHKDIEEGRGVNLGEAKKRLGIS